MGIIIDEFTPQELASERAKRQPREGGRFVKREAEPEPESNPRQEAADAAFMARNQAPESGPPVAEAPETGLDLPDEVKGAVAGAGAGAALGSRFGATGLAVGAVVGAGVGIAASKKPDPVASFQGGQAKSGGGDDLRQLLEIQRHVASVGLPLKNAITTSASGSRW